MDEASSFVFDFFAERHIALKQDWLSNVLAFLLTSLEEVTINSIVDIGAPFHLQFTTLVYEFVDDSGFEPLPDMETGGHSDLWEKPRRMLLLTVSDGETEFKAIEYRSIKALSLLIKPGCKVLLIPPVRCRKDVFLLNPESIQIIGGDVESLFATGRPLQIMTKKLNVTIPTSSARGATERTQVQSDAKGSQDNDSKQHKSASLQHTRTESKVSRCANEMSKYMIVAGIPNSANSKRSPSVGEASAVNMEECRVASCLEETTPMAIPNPCNRTRPIAQVSPLHQICRSSSVELEESPPDFEAELERLRATESSSFRGGKASNTTKGIQTADVDDTSRNNASSTRETNSPRSAERNRNTKLSLQLQTPAPTKRDKQDEWQPSSSKKVKVEVITLDDDEHKPSDVALHTTTATSCATQVFSQAPQPQQDNRSDLIGQFRALNIVRLADAVRLMRFAVGSCRKTVQAIVVDIVDSLRIVDEMWTMKVTVQDESIDSLLCIIDNTSLTSLIGLTPKEAMEVRTSNDVSRRRDGQRRLAAVEAQLKRLDLVLELELFSGGRADPVIRNIRTLMQALDVL
ncbi:hypothetical protein ANCCAN_15430 [Ancylostoma caninum]|uniref:RecQ-mediated genome instability protein 1 n=1 Tax=Ancylostoma caninum TaxID=29170 RepID=A0A368G2H3_ANCCA|nr:hypothetical protein ANCCAN_15430 [Ancylostoma caninum]